VLLSPLAIVAGKPGLADRTSASVRTSAPGGQAAAGAGRSQLSLAVRADPSGPRAKAALETLGSRGRSAARNGVRACPANRRESQTLRKARSQPAPSAELAVKLDDDSSDQLDG
jgi:hypothetical protein